MLLLEIIDRVMVSKGLKVNLFGLCRLSNADMKS